jgi:uncharacterized coiled-coil DUF342 family protein
MAYDGEIRINTKLNNDGVSKGVKETQAEIKKISSALDSVNTQIIKQQAVVDNLRKKYEEAAVQAEKIGQMHGLDSKEFELSAKGVDRLLRGLTEAESKLSGFKSQSEALQYALSSVSAEAAADGIRDTGQAAEKSGANIDRLKTILAGLGKMRTRKY